MSPQFLSLLLQAYKRVCSDISDQERICLSMYVAIQANTFTNYCIAYDVGREKYWQNHSTCVFGWQKLWQIEQVFYYILIHGQCLDGETMADDC